MSFNKRLGRVFMILSVPALYAGLYSCTKCPSCADLAHTSQMACGATWGEGSDNVHFGCTTGLDGCGFVTDWGYCTFGDDPHWPITEDPEVTGF